MTKRSQFLSPPQKSPSILDLKTLLWTRVFSEIIFAKKTSAKAIRFVTATIKNLTAQKNL